MARDQVQVIANTRVGKVELARRLQRPGLIVGYDPKLRPSHDVVPLFAFFLNDLTAETHIKFRIGDFQTDSDVVITFIGTIPATAQRQGFASSAVQEMLTWACENGLHEIRATPVSDPAYERFWEKNGFVRSEDPNPYGDYVYRW